jgi:nucleotide-binding universal stress UspA family protein
LAAFRDWLETSPQERSREVYVQRVVTGLSGSAGSLQALRYATEMARHHDATLVPVLAWVPPGGELADRRYPCRALREAWARAAWERFWRAVDLAIAGPPTDVRFLPQVVRGDPGQVLAWLAGEPGDVLVIGAGRHGVARRALSCRVTRYCVGHAVCPVISVPPSSLADQAHGLRGWMARHRLDPSGARLHGAEA